MFLCKECLTCGHDWHGSGSRGPCESCRQFSVTADCHHATLGTHESIRAKKSRLEKERKEGVINHLRDDRTGQIITGDELTELARIPILEDEIGRLKSELTAAKSNFERVAKKCDVQNMDKDALIRQNQQFRQELAEVVKFQGVRATRIRELEKEFEEARHTGSSMDIELQASQMREALLKDVAEAVIGWWQEGRSSDGDWNFGFFGPPPLFCCICEPNNPNPEPEEHADGCPVPLAEKALAMSKEPGEGKLTVKFSVNIADKGSKWCSTCKLYHKPDATSWSHAVEKAELEEGYQNSEQTNTLCQVCGGLGRDGQYSCEPCDGTGIAGLMKWCENCHGYHDPNGPHPAGSAG